MGLPESLTMRPTKWSIGFYSKGEVYGDVQPTDKEYDDVVNWPANWDFVYFFEGDRYYRHDKSQNSGKWNYITYSTWPGLDGVKIDAAVEYDSGDPNGINKKLYIFSGDQYYSYDATRDEVDENYPRSIKCRFDGLKKLLKSTNEGVYIITYR